MKNWARWIVRLAVTLAIVAVPIYALKVYHKNDYTDFSVYYKAGSRVLNAQWNDVYTLSDGASPYRYAPAFLPFFSLFAHTDPVTARVLWFFLQTISFALCFWVLHKLFVRLRHRRSKALPTSVVLSLGFLMILRLCLDTFTIGQVSSLMLLGFALALYFWVFRRESLFAVTLFVPAFFKIGPALLYGLLIQDRNLKLVRATLTVLALSLLALALPWLLWGTDVQSLLWQKWRFIISADSQYFDAAHYGSQSLKSTLLRAVDLLHLPRQLAELLWLCCALIGVAATGLMWGLRSPKSLYGRALFFAAGLFPYLWFMPETFKYTLTVLLIPITVLLFDERKANRLTQIGIALTALFISFAAKDFLPAPVFFGIQKLSLPFVATLVLGAAVFWRCWQESFLSMRGRRIWLALTILLKQRSLLSVVSREAELPKINESAESQVVVLLPLPLTRDSSFGLMDTELFCSWLDSLHRKLLQRFGASRCHVLCAPYGELSSPVHPELLALQKRLSSSVTVLPFARPANGTQLQLRNTALTRASRLIPENFKGAVMVINREQPCSEAFYLQALEAIEQNTALVRADRRHPESRFRIPVRYLPFVYGRHRLGLLFNKLLRTLLPLKSRDTHSGSYVMSADCATSFFAAQKQPGFLMDVELSLHCHRLGLREISKPVTIVMAQEKSLLRIIEESVMLLRELPRLLRNSAQNSNLGKDLRQ